MAIFKGAKNRDDTFVGGSRADTFLFDPADLTRSDVIVGGGGRRGDTLQFTASGAIGASALAGVSEIERIVLADGANSIVLNDMLVSTADGTQVKVIGGSGDDLVYAAGLTGSNAIDVDAGGGADLLLGGLGADSFTFAVSELDDADVVTALNGGTVDRLILTGSGSLSAAQLAGVTGIEAIDLGDGGVQIALTESMGLSAESNQLTVTGGAGADTIDASLIAFDAANFPSWTLLGGGGDDIIVGTTGFGSYIDGGAGADTIDAGLASVVYDGRDVHEIVTEGGYLIVNGGARIDLTNNDDQSARDRAVVQGFNSVDASASNESVVLTGLYYSTLRGGSGDDVLTGGAFLVGGKGADVLTGGDADNSTTFYLGSGDFVAGESITGNGVSDQIYAVGSTDFRLGSVKGIETLVVFSDGDPQTHVTLSGTIANGLSSVFFSGQSVTDTLAVDLYLQRHVSTNFDFNVFGGTLTIHGTGAGEVITHYGASILGGGGDDVITGNGILSGDGGDDLITGSGSLSGGEGDDVVTATGVDAGDTFDGGTGTDTLVVRNWYFDLPSEINLSLRDQSVGDTAIIRNFENIDLSGCQSDLTIIGSSANNIIFGGLGNNEIHGGRGNDTLIGNSFDGTNIIDGGAGDDLIFAATGFSSISHLTGGSGADTFRWDTRPDYYYDTIDTISDFKPGQDHLAFAKTSYGFAGSAFDTLIVATGTDTNITRADLVIYRGDRIDYTYQLGEYLSNAAGGGDHGLFIAALNTAGHTVVYYSPSADYGDEFSLTYVADLGDIGQPTNLTLNDFSFI